MSDKPPLYNGHDPYTWEVIRAYNFDGFHIEVRCFKRGNGVGMDVFMHDIVRDGARETIEYAAAIASGKLSKEPCENI